MSSTLVIAGSLRAASGRRFADFQAAATASRRLCPPTAGLMRPAERVGSYLGAAVMLYCFARFAHVSPAVIESHHQGEMTGLPAE